MDDEKLYERLTKVMADLKAFDDESFMGPKDARKAVLLESFVKDLYDEVSYVEEFNNLPDEIETINENTLFEDVPF
jgi:hypothetical protein